MRCSASLQRLVRWAVSGPQVHSWTTVADAASGAGLHGHAAVARSVCAGASRRHLWQDGRLSNGAPAQQAPCWARAGVAAARICTSYRCHPAVCAGLCQRG